MIFHYFFFFFFNDTATTEIYTLSLHDALPISIRKLKTHSFEARAPRQAVVRASRKYTAYKIRTSSVDRKSTRLNSSHGYISYAVFCLKKKKNKKRNTGENLYQAQKETHTAGSS